MPASIYVRDGAAGGGPAVDLGPLVVCKFTVALLIAYISISVFGDGVRTTDVAEVSSPFTAACTFYGRLTTRV